VRRQKTLEALTAQLAGLASQHPVLIIFEDVHWTDPTSLEAFGRAVDRIKTLRALLIVTFRPEFNAPWVGQPHVTSLTLNRLGERDAATINRTPCREQGTSGRRDGGNRGPRLGHFTKRGIPSVRVSVFEPTAHSGLKVLRCG
jgi:hypothetical protein